MKNTRMSANKTLLLLAGLGVALLLVVAGIVFEARSQDDNASQAETSTAQSDDQASTETTIFEPIIVLADDSDAANTGVSPYFIGNNVAAYSSQVHIEAALDAGATGTCTYRFTSPTAPEITFSETIDITPMCFYSVDQEEFSKGATYTVTTTFVRQDGVSITMNNATVTIP